MEKISIFKGIDEKEIEKIIKILDIKPVVYSKNKIIISNDETTKYLGIILEGNANIEKYDYDGNRSILEKLNKNSLFGNMFFRSIGEISIVATNDCKVVLFEYDVLISKVKNRTLLCNLYERYNNEILKLNTRIEILSKRTIREKLLTYFFVLTKNKPKTTFVLPYTYTELADYLCIDRSAMMREIKKMKDVGIIETNGKKIKLFN